ncbi:hypothetical protein L1987_50574 [Smallanthus sonchifolius]|uniref:Uncharacterized protein n=1 Tax=Smallanthus sonchifolius TaxID=185202 RepID=A0ACB9ENI8_9ASTR|nr:hypothetical protein L1987_50574 [Smallanthus sonchifolius]
MIKTSQISAYSSISRNGSTLHQVAQNLEMNRIFFCRLTSEDNRSLSPPANQGYLTKMYLQFYINENGDKVYTTKKESPIGLATQSAHPARFSPDDKFSRQRVLLKKRFGLLPIQKPAPKY